MQKLREREKDRESESCKGVPKVTHSCTKSVPDDQTVPSVRIREQNRGQDFSIGYLRLTHILPKAVLTEHCLGSAFVCLACQFV